MKRVTCCSHLSQDSTDFLTRRGFVRLAALGGGAALLASFAPRLSLAAGNTEAMLLSCMDFRLMAEIAKYMDSRFLTHNYDHVVLAGASLGALNEKTPSWGQTFWDHLDVAMKLHHIKKVMVMDHRDCGAYKVFIGPEHMKDAASEKEVHAWNLNRLKLKIKERQPELEVELLLMDLEGKVEVIS
jgi:carbonic anhydrase